MKKLLNTLFVLSEDVYLSLDGENLVVNRDKAVIARYPLHTLTEVICFSYAGASPALMGACAVRSVSMAFCTPRGRFLARTVGETSGNVLLRRKQYRTADSDTESCRIARMMIFGKVSNCRSTVRRTLRDHALRVDSEKMEKAAQTLKDCLPQIAQASELDTLRGLEGAAANCYFSVFDDLILNRKEVFRFTGRSRRPPLDETNALLSFSYSLLANDCRSALEAVGLDSYVGFLHRDRPGRSSLALDLMEELRPCVADRFTLSLINNRVFSEKDFQKMESGAVLLTDDGRKTFLKAWQERKKELITHPYLEEKLQWGMVPYVQALLLARYFRGDMEDYPPFIWK